MQAKRQPKTTGRNRLRVLSAHGEASRRTQEWAAKCLAFRAADKPAQAKIAEQKARHWLRKLLSLEAKTGRKSQLVHRV
jgi:hypothetical protein